MAVDRWVFVEVGYSDSLYFSKEIGSKACQLNMSLELENKGKVKIHGDLGEWESDQSKKMQNGS